MVNVKFSSTPAPTESPWGKVEEATECAPGIWFVSTMSHGGFQLSPERQCLMPAGIENINFLMSREWYEEDCDANWVVARFREFGEQHHKAKAFLPSFIKTLPLAKRDEAMAILQGMMAPAA